MRSAPLLTVGVLALLAGCSLTGDAPDLDLLDGSVDGLRLGDPRSRVAEALGEPDSRTEAGDLVAVTYGAGAAERLRVTTYDGVVQGLYVRPAYAGRTAGGVRVGSSRADVEREIGTTFMCSSVGTFTCFYDQPGHTVAVAYGGENAVRGFAMVRRPS